MAKAWAFLDRIPGTLSCLIRNGVFVAVASTLATPSFTMSGIETLVGRGSAGSGLDGSRAARFQMGSQFGVIEAPDDTVKTCNSGNRRVRLVLR